jgi:hypothetical protein
MGRTPRDGTLILGGSPRILDAEDVGRKSADAVAGQ